MTSCLKTVAAAAATLCLSLSAWAQSGTSVYGLVDMSGGKLQNAGDAKLTKLESGNMATSFIGFKGGEDLGGGLKAKFALESFLRADTGQSGRFDNDVFWARAAWVGLEGSFGSTTLGRTTNQYFVSTLIFNALGDSFGYSSSIRQFLTPSVNHGGGTALAFFGDTGWSNSVLYSSPNFGGLSFNLQGNLGEKATGAYGNNFGGNVLYFGGPFAATFAYQKVKNGVGTFNTPTVQLTGFESQESMQVGASYDFGVAKLFAQVAETKTSAATDTKTTLYGLGASVPVGAGKVLAQYGNADQDFGGVGPDKTNDTVTLAYDYFLSKRTDVYALYMYDKFTGVGNGNTYVLGLRTTF